MPFDRITVEPDKLEGRPCIRGLRITLEYAAAATDVHFHQLLAPA
jgi:uncharacterized protein (DUF433 family)